MALPWLAVSKARFCLSRLAQVSGCLSSSLVSFSLLGSFKLANTASLRSHQHLDQLF